FDLPEAAGALVLSVQRGLPGAVAGLREGDVITHIDGVKVKDTSELIRIVSSHRPSETVNLGLIRDGRPLTLKVRLGDRAKETAKVEKTGSPEDEESTGSDDDAAAADVATKFGIKAKDLDAETVRMMKLPNDHQKGVFVESVRPSSNAYE